MYEIMALRVMFGRERREMRGSFWWNRMRNFSGSLGGEYVVRSLLVCNAV
jgi:hypothetical protein